MINNLDALSIFSQEETKSALWVMFQGSYKHVVITDESSFFSAVASLSVELVAVLFWHRMTCSFYSLYSSKCLDTSVHCCVLGLDH